MFALVASSCTTQMRSKRGDEVMHIATLCEQPDVMLDGKKVKTRHLKVAPKDEEKSYWVSICEGVRGDRIVWSNGYNLLIQADDLYRIQARDENATLVAYAAGAVVGAFVVLVGAVAIVFITSIGY